MFEFLSKPLSERVGRSVYDFISNISHPTLYTHFQMWTTAEQDGQRTVVSQISLEDHEKRVGMAVVPTTRR